MFNPRPEDLANVASRRLENWALPGLASGAVSEIDVIGPLLPAVARDAILAWAHGEPKPPVSRAGAPRMPVFVTLRNRDGALRGCIGALDAVEADVIAETERSAVLAASRDPRFAPVRGDEISGLRIEVSVLFAPEPVSGLGDLDPRRYGLIVRGEGRQALLLPEVPGIDDPRLQVAVTKKKAGLAVDAPATLSRFEVRKFSEL
jgi:MEMO1 family protein